MKKMRIITIFLCTVFIVSCDDWLMLEPEDTVIREDFWKSKEDVHAAVMGCYASLLGNYDGKDYGIPDLLFLWGEVRADMIIPYRLKTEFRYIYNGDILPDNAVCKWKTFYSTINFCNTVLAFAPGVMEADPTFTQETLKQYESEALALRALMYFYLARSFDEVPLKLTATKSDAERFSIPKSSRKAIFNQIKSDLAKAEKNIPYSYGDNDSDKGRITKYTINAVQADVYLWNEQYDSCIIACDKIINSGLFGLIEGGPDWFKTLYVDGNSNEGIFELQFSQSKLNPYYNLFWTSRYFIASPNAIEEFFPFDANILPDSADIRADGASYNTAYNYSLWKYLGKDNETIRTLSESYAHFIVYRYAEILLFKAEALAQTGREEEAVNLVRMIRNRAHASKVTDIGTGSMDRITVTDFILAERAREFAYEGKRWYDVLRNAKRNQYERKQLIIDMVLMSAPADKQVAIKNKYQDTLFHYFPIFYTELDANQALEQNEFYAD